MHAGTFTAARGVTGGVAQEAVRGGAREARRKGLGAVLTAISPKYFPSGHYFRWPCGAASGIQLFQRPSNQL
jgi:hypothetical protein